MGMWTYVKKLSFILEYLSVIAFPGGVWPKPKYLRSTDNYFLIDPKNFSILVSALEYNMI